MIHVFQSQNFSETSFGFGPDEVLAALLSGLVTYQHVATVNTHDHEVAYERTNTIHESWWRNPGITTHFTGQGCRSTSMGDILRDCDRIFIVASFGFKEVTDLKQADINKHFTVKE